GDAMRFGLLRLALAALALIVARPPAVEARPAHKQSAAQYFGTFLPKKLNDCTLCHLPDPPGAKQEEGSDKPHNPIGARLKAVRATGIEDRLDAILDEDSDGDGVSNLIEILTGHAPGDAKDRPAASELGEIKQAVAAFRKMRASYPWRPFEIVRRPDVPKVKN